MKPPALEIGRIRALCFDVDGTLSDTDDLYVAQASRLLRVFLPQRTALALARWLVMRAESPGNALYALADRLGLDDRIYRALSRRRPKPTAPGHFLLVPGVREMLTEAVKHYPLAIVSARGEYTTLQFLEQHHLRPFFRVVVTAHTCRRTKPSAEPLLWAAERLGVPPESCVMIGDTVVDIRVGRAAGAQTIGVLCGFGERDELARAGADLILPQTADIVNLLPGGLKPESVQPPASS
ncbi:MAG: phosphoglycolate phosphatase [Anaerolineales bacterium]